LQQELGRVEALALLYFLRDLLRFVEIDFRMRFLDERIDFCPGQAWQADSQLDLYSSDAGTPNAGAGEVVFERRVR